MLSRASKAPGLTGRELSLSNLCLPNAGGWGSCPGPWTCFLSRGKWVSGAHDKPRLLEHKTSTRETVRQLGAGRSTVQVHSTLGFQPNLSTLLGVDWWSTLNVFAIKPATQSGPFLSLPLRTRAPLLDTHPDVIKPC